eukprot:TRINITY_DN14112_c0_g1_i1.p1 TRINITY_DN14112_c0_g1~~TRINITY_DN14112_c0_g1_i1.p1  ORF type:complete len:318 (-),score=70.45 TRINITY_DN14112_c0_g1_i1:129-1082(-)
MLRLALNALRTSSIKPLNHIRNMATLPRRIGAAQMCSTSDKDANFKACEELCAAAKSKGVQLLCLPECFAFIGNGQMMHTWNNAEPLSGPSMQRYKDLARTHNMWLSLGGFHELLQDRPAVIPDDPVDAPSKISNTHVIVNSDGDVVQVYRKMHLFDINIPGGPVMRESRLVEGGTLLETCDSPVGKLGLSVCYDVRFPDVYISLALQGARVLLVPSAFTATTGKAHWHTLLKARAIENQCYVVAAAQYGWHHSKRESYGHTIIIDPWGDVVDEINEGPGVITCDINEDFIQEMRTRMPVWQHRRPHLYRTSGTSSD